MPRFGLQYTGSLLPFNVTDFRIMNISDNSVVTLSYQLFDASGTLLEASHAPITYLHGSHHGIFPKIEEALDDKAPGDSCSVTLEPEDAFGDYDADLVRVEAQDRFPADVKVGMQFEGYTERGGDDTEGIVFRVTDIADGKVVVDGNHPYAGQRMRFECTVLDVRPGTAEEIEHGHVHGEHDHHH